MYPQVEKDYGHADVPSEKQYGYADGPSEKQYGHSYGKSEKQYGYADGPSEKQYGHSDGKSEKQFGYTHAPPQAAQVVQGIPVAQPSVIQTTPPAQQPGPGYWSTGFCDCFSDVGSCCLVCWCPCVAFGRLSEIVDKGNSSCVGNGSLYLALCSLGALGMSIGLPLSCQWIYSCTYREKIKQELGMPPSCCEECCLHFWCEPCALCQEYREIQNRGYDLSLGWNGNQERMRLSRGNQTPGVAPVAPSMAR